MSNAENLPACPQGKPRTMKQQCCRCEVKANVL